MLKFSLEKSIFVVNCATLFYLYSCDIREPEKLPLGRRGNMLNHKVRGFLRGWVGWSNFKKLVQDMNWFFLYSFLWGSFMWQKQDQKVELFLGKLWENLTTIFAKWKHQSKCKIYLIWYWTLGGPLQMQGATHKILPPRLFYMRICSWAMPQANKRSTI